MHRFALVALLLVAGCDSQNKSGHVNPCAELAVQPTISNYKSYNIPTILQRGIEQKILYPEEARSALQQGDVCLRLRIDREGVLLFSKIEYTSSYPLLDGAVINAARDASPYQVESEDFGDSYMMEFLIPIKFKLRL